MSENISYNVWADPDTGKPVNPQNATPNDDKSAFAVNVLGPGFDNPTSTLTTPKEETVKVKFGEVPVTPLAPGVASELDDDEDAAVVQAIAQIGKVVPDEPASSGEEAALIGSIKRLENRRKTEPNFANPRLHDIARRESQRDGGARKKVMDALKRAGVK